MHTVHTNCSLHSVLHMSSRLFYTVYFVSVFRWRPSGAVLSWAGGRRVEGDSARGDWQRREREVSSEGHGHRRQVSSDDRGGDSCPGHQRQQPSLPAGQLGCFFQNLDFIHLFIFLLIQLLMKKNYMFFFIYNNSLQFAPQFVFNSLWTIK